MRGGGGGVACRSVRTGGPAVCIFTMCLISFAALLMCFAQDGESSCYYFALSVWVGGVVFIMWSVV